MLPGARAAALIGAVLLLQPVAAVAQLGHPAPPERRPRALHARLAASDALAIGTIEAVDAGRIRVGAVRAQRGELAAHLELKRAPSAPPPLAAQQRVLLLLRGARSPYLLVDEPDELWILQGEAQEDALVQALPALDAAASQPQALAALYAGWLASDDVLLARAAAQGFEGDEALRARAPATTLARLALAALESSDAALRGAALRAALHQDASLRALLEGLPGAAADPEVVVRALSAGVLRQRDAARAAALRSLAHIAPEMRGAVLQLGALWAADPALRAAIGRLASDDPDEQVRLAARRALAR